MASNPQFDESDKRWAAVHEAAHLVVNFATGVRARAEIWPIDEAHRIGDRTWAGEATAMRSFAASPAVGMAGYVAESLQNEPHVSAEWIAANWWKEIDAGGGSTAPTTDEHRATVLAAIKSAMEILAQHRPFYEWAVDELMTAGLISDATAADAFRTLK